MDGETVTPHGCGKIPDERLRIIGPRHGANKRRPYLSDDGLSAEVHVHQGHKRDHRDRPATGEILGLVRTQKAHDLSS